MFSVYVEHLYCSSDEHVLSLNSFVILLNKPVY